MPVWKEFPVYIYVNEWMNTSTKNTSAIGCKTYALSPLGLIKHKGVLILSYKQITSDNKNTL